MPKIKALAMILSVLTLSFLMIGCEMIFDRDAEPEEPETAENGELPEWLLSEHRTAREEEEEPLKPKDPEEEEAEEEEAAEPEPAEEAAEPEPAEEQVAQEGTGDQHAVEAETEEDDQAAAEEEPEPEQVTDQRWMRGTYTGEWLDGGPHGEGTFNHPSGGQLIGNWIEGQPHGEFTRVAPDGTTDTVYFDRGEIAEAEEPVTGDETNWWEPGTGEGDTFFSN